jgi:hypothetical protein
VDAHVLATPSLADINSDGAPELILSVSYFFDEEEFNNNPHVTNSFRSRFCLLFSGCQRCLFEIVIYSSSSRCGH